MFEDHPVKSGDTDEGLCLKPLDRLQHPIQIDFGLQNQCTSETERGKLTCLTEDMKQRGAGQNGILLHREEGVAHV